LKDGWNFVKEVVVAEHLIVLYFREICYNKGIIIKELYYVEN